jgi:outer-membrane receptor for ferric coprogen and ferric-rhodotorulic acid
LVQHPVSHLPNLVFLLRAGGFLMRITLRAVAMALFASVLPVSAQAVIQHYQLNIPRQPLDTALKDFASQTGLQIAAMSDAIDESVLVGPVRGDFSATTALNSLLGPKCLTYKFVNSRTIAVIEPASAAAQSLGFAPAGSMNSGAEPSQSISSQQGKKETSPKGDGFRVAQANQGQTSGAGPLDKGKISQSGGFLQEVVITSSYEFLSADTSGTTNLPLPIEKVPQSISLISQDFIKAADLKTLGEIAEYTPGAINVGNPANNGSIIELRGFTAGRAIDGLPVDISNGTQYEPDYAIYNRLEVVKGPTSVVYGVSSPGGLVNLVTKSATPETKDYLLAQVGSWDSFRLEGQVAGPLDSAGRVRAIGIAVRDQGDSFMDIEKHAKTTVYGGVNVRLSDSVTGYLHGGYERFVRNEFDGIPTEPDGSPPPVPRSFFIGSPAILLTSSVSHAEANLTWHVTNLWQLQVKGNYENGDTMGSDAYGFGLQPNGNISLSAFRFDLPGTGSDFRNYGIGVSSIYYLDALGIRDSFVSVAALDQDSRTGFAGISPPGSGIVTSNIFAGESVISQALDSLITAAATQPVYSSFHQANTATYSAQAVLKLLDPLTLLLGAAYSKPHTKIISSTGVQDFDFTGQVSYRGGITYEIVHGFNAYVSYSQSFSPQLLTSLDNNGVSHYLPPLVGEQYETGLKYRARGGRLMVTGALFEIKQKNQGQFQTFANGTDYFIPVGEVTNKGAELEVIGQITPQWQVHAGYAYLDPKVTKDSEVQLEGQTSLYLPKSTFDLYTTYTLPAGLLRGLTLGGGIRYVSPERTSYDSAFANAAAGLSPTRDLPGYSLLDLTASYAFDKWLLQLNARNVSNRHYFINNYQTLFFGNVVGEPTNIALTIRREF